MEKKETHKPKKITPKKEKASRNNKIIIGIVAIILVIGLGYFVMNKPTVNQNQDSDNMMQDSKGSEKGVSIKDIFSSGQSYQCTYTTPQGESITKIKGKKVRAEGFGFSTSGGMGTGGMINDGEWIYIWGDEDKKGMKYELSAIETEEMEDDIENLRNPEKWAADLENQYEINCKKAKFKDGEFTPPSDIEFQDLTGFMKEAQKLQDKFETDTTEETSTEDLPSEEDLQEIKDLMESLPKQ